MPGESAGNLFGAIPDTIREEVFEPLLDGSSFKLERIVSSGQATAPGEWYDQELDEWVVLLTGSATLLFDGEAHPRQLGPGDYLFIPAHHRHRVEWTDPATKTVWLALHCKARR